MYLLEQIAQQPAQSPDYAAMRKFNAAEALKATTLLLRGEANASAAELRIGSIGAE